MYEIYKCKSYCGQSNEKLRRETFNKKGMAQLNFLVSYPSCAAVASV
jgi:hypothetical protein